DRMNQVGFDPPSGLEVEIVEVDGETLLVFSWTRRSGSAVVALTPTEREVLEAVCAGRSNAAIAAARGTAVRTVANQVASLLRKFRVRSRHELAAKLAVT
ncbi:MAG TPA: LuxR C-terminal-related transcriptional regulator, partial [Polyangiaceae bacterium]